jgi:histidine triad (HIT) family protein
LTGEIVLKQYPTNKHLNGMTQMAQDCIFCHIIRKEAPANEVYEDQQVVVFLSNRPVNEGHTLVVPKKHYENIFEIPEDEAAYLFRVAKRVAFAVRTAIATEGIRIVQNNGWAAGQVVFHLHVHVIPMEPNDNFVHGKVFRDHTNSRGSEELQKDAKKIRQHLKP